MKTLGFIIGGILIVGVLIVGIVLVKDYQDEKKELKASTKIEENVFDTMVSSEEKIQEAQNLLSKKETNLNDQTKAKRLIDEAIADAKKATEMQPDNPRPWYYLSEAYQKLRDVNPKAVELSIEALHHAIRLAPQDANLLNERATMFIIIEKYNEAEKDLQKAVQLDPRNAKHFYKLGNIYKKQNKIELARECYLQAKELTSVENKVALAQIDHQMKDLDKIATKSATKE